MENAMERLLKLSEEWSRYSELKNGWHDAMYLDNSIWCWFQRASKYRAVYFDWKELDRTEVTFYKNPAIRIPIKNNNPEYINNLCSKYEELLKIERGLE